LGALNELAERCIFQNLRTASFLVPFADREKPVAAEFSRVDRQESQEGSPLLWNQCPGCRVDNI